MKQLLIYLEKLPDEGKLFEGEIEADLYEFLSSDTINPAGPLQFSLFVQRFDNELFVRGKISSPFSLVCVRSLNSFVQTIVLDDFSTSIEIGEQAVVDLTGVLREEVVLNLPSHPKCTEADVPMECIVNSEYFRVDNPPQDGVNSCGGNQNSGVWDALDSIQPSND